MRPILFCSWDISQHGKWIPPSPNSDGLPVWRHFQNGVSEISEITFSPISRLGYIETRSWCLYPYVEDEESNDEITNRYDSWFTRNSKWLSFKPAKITFSAIFWLSGSVDNCSWALILHYDICDLAWCYLISVGHLGIQNGY